MGMMGIAMIVLVGILVAVIAHDINQSILLDRISDKYYVSQTALKNVVNYLAKEDT